MKLSDISIHSWLGEHQIKNEQGVPLDFRDHLFLFDIYSDQSPKLVIYKAAQIGMSTCAILKSLWLAKHKKLDIIYTMPSSSDMKDFVGGKVNRLIAQNPVLLNYVKDKDSVEQKQVGENIIYYRGTWGERAAIAVSSDLNIHDEEDRSKQQIIQTYTSRLQHSKYKWEWHFSNPSVEGNGVSRYWSRSDQKHWFIVCLSCNKEQYLEWPASINVQKQQFVCKYCGSELSREERRVGRWVRRYKDREFSGYWISLLMAPWVTADEIIKYYETKSAEYFSNFVLGLPYVGEGNQVTPDIIFRNCTPDINSQERVVIGCDSGLKKHYVLGNRDGIFYAGIAQDWSEIDSLLKKYKRSIAVIDALPDLTEPRRLRERYPGRVFLCHYARDRKTFQLIRWGKGEEMGNVVVDRNRMIQVVIDEFANKNIPLQGMQDDWDEYANHWDTLYKITELDTLGVPQFIWESSNGLDHFVHATVYWRVGMDRFKNDGGKIFTGETLFPVSQPVREETMMSKTKFIYEEKDE
ncbi:MAG: phage terminase large subunit family protein [Patescibacteria group bacterium]